jgi:hypothetical protein
MAEQYALTQDPDLNIQRVWIARNSPIDKTECPTINVSLYTGAFDSWNEESTGGVYQYAIDIYTDAKSTNVDGLEQPGDSLANFKLDKVMGKCRAILENTVFYLLLFPAPFIRSTWCEGFQIKKNGPDDDMSTAMARLVFVVSCMENNTLPDPTGSAKDVVTTVKLGQSEEGYYWENLFSY